MDLKEIRTFDYGIFNFDDVVVVKPSWDNNLLSFCPTTLKNNAGELYPFINKSINSKKEIEIKIASEGLVAYTQIFGGWFKLFNTIEFNNRKFTQSYVVNEINDKNENIVDFEDRHPMYGFYKYLRKIYKQITDSPVIVRLGYLLAVPAHVVIKENKPFLGSSNHPQERVPIVILQNSAVKSFLKNLGIFVMQNFDAVKNLDLVSDGFFVSVAQDTFFEVVREGFNSYVCKVTKDLDIGIVPQQIEASRIYKPQKEFHVWEKLLKPFNKENEINILYMMDSLNPKDLLNYFNTRFDVPKEIVERLSSRVNVTNMLGSNHSPRPFVDLVESEEFGRPQIEEGSSQIDYNKIPEDIRKLLTNK